MIPLRTAKSLASFSGGLNTSPDPFSLKDNESPYLLNLHTDIDEDLIGRMGFEELNSIATGATYRGNGLYDYGVSATVRKLIGVWHDTVYKMDDLDGTWDALTPALSNDIHEFETFNFGGTNYLLIVNWSRDYMYSWDNSGAAMSQISNAPQAQHIVVYKNHVLLSGISASPDYFQYSTIGTYDTWPSANEEPVRTTDGDYLTGWGKLQGYLYCFKRNSIHRVVFAGGTVGSTTDPYWIIKQVANIGCTATKTIQLINIPGVGERLCFLGTDNRLYIFDGDFAIPVSGKVESNNGISPISLATLNQNQMKYHHAVVYPEKNWYMLFVANAISSDINYAIVFDYYRFSQQGMGIFPFSNMSFRSAALVENTIGKKKIYASGYAGKTYLLDSTNYDSGTNINRFWTSKRIHFGDPSFSKKNRLAYIYPKTTGNFTVNFYYRSGWDITWSSAESITLYTDEWVLGDVLPITLGARIRLQYVAELPTVSDIIQMKLERNANNPPYRISRIDIKAEALPK